MTTSETVSYMGHPLKHICFVKRTEQGEYRYTLHYTSGKIEDVDVGETQMLVFSRAQLAAPCLGKRKAPANSLPEDDAKRAQYPMADGLIDYFPNALAEVSRVSFIGSQKHNKGEPMHWARGKSTDHRNKIARHLVDAGGVDEVVMEDGTVERVRHSAYLAWRALANLQEELEREEGYRPSRASKF